MISICQIEKTGNYDDYQFESLVKRIQDRFIKNIQTNGPLFTTNNSDIWGSYLNSFSDRQYHNCNACKNFILRYGTLVVVDNEGRAIPAMWDSRDAECDEKQAIISMQKSFDKSKITGVFLSNNRVWGTPKTGQWKHFYVKPTSGVIYDGVVNTPDQVMAEKKEDFKNIIRAIREFSPEIVNTALSLLKMDTLYMGEKVLGPVQWLNDLIESISKKTGKQRTNLIWKAVALAPRGFCHPRSSMAGTLLEDIASGIDFEVAARRFKEKMNPLRYQRPQAAPTKGNIERAEKIVEKLGIKDSLRRRFARIDEIKPIWQPKEIEQNSNVTGIFSHLKQKGTVTNQDVPVSVITWEKFSKNILPECASIQYMVRNRDNFAALLTSAVDGAPPILKWDSIEERNPFSYYVYNHWSLANDWRLKHGHLVDVTAITNTPAEWGTRLDHYTKGIIFILSGAVDTKDSGLAIFPDALKSELHEIRSTIEAFSKSGKIEGRENASACGVMMAGRDEFNGVIRVKTLSGIIASYKIDRMS